MSAQDDIKHKITWGGALLTTKAADELLARYAREILDDRLARNTPAATGLICISYPVGYRVRVFAEGGITHYAVEPE